MIPRDPAARDTLAGSYVLGTLRGAARRRFEKAMREDEALRAAVRAWERRLDPLNEDIAAEAPPDRVWEKVEAALAPTPTRPALWNSLAFWRWLSLGLAGAAAALLALAVLRPAPLEPLPIVAVLQDQAKEPVWTLRLAPERILVVDTLRPQSPGSGRSLQLWILPEGATAPAAGPLLPASGVATTRLDPGLAALLERAGQVLVSVEPQGGAPAGAPTGPVLYAGRTHPR